MAQVIQGAGTRAGMNVENWPNPDELILEAEKVPARTRVRPISAYTPVSYAPVIKVLLVKGLKWSEVHEWFVAHGIDTSLSSIKAAWNRWRDK